MIYVKHVLLITKEFQSDFQRNSGGTGVFYKNLSDELVKKGIKVSIFGSSKNPFTLEKENFLLLFVKDYFKKYKWMEFLRSISGKFSFLEKWHFKMYESEQKYLENELANFIKNKKIDLIETHDWEGMGNIVEKLSVPYVIRCHGSWSVLEKFFGYKAAKGKIFLEKKAFRNARNFITISKDNQKMVKEVFDSKNYQLIYNGIDTDFFRPQDDIEILPKSIFFVGTISSEKGAETALKSFFEVQEKEPDSTFHFVGRETKFVDELKKEITNKNLEQKVYFYGMKSPEELVKLLARAEVVYFPSKGEMFGLSLIEAMAMEKPVICSDLEVFKEIITDNENGLVAKSTEEFADKSIEMFHNKNKASQLGENARKTVVEKFSLKQMTEKTLDYYERIVNQ